MIMVNTHKNVATLKIPRMSILNLELTFVWTCVGTFCL